MKHLKKFNESNGSIDLIRGQFYKSDGEIYLVGDNVEAIPNMFIYKVTKGGDLIGYEESFYGDEPTALLRTQYSDQFEKTDPILIKRKYKMDLVRFFFNKWYKHDEENYPREWYDYVEKFLKPKKNK